MLPSIKGLLVDEFSGFGTGIWCEERLIVDWMRFDVVSGVLVRVAPSAHVDHRLSVAHLGVMQLLPSRKDVEPDEDGASLDLVLHRSMGHPSRAVSLAAAA